MRTYCIAQGTPLIALRWPKWEGNPQKEGLYDITYMWNLKKNDKNELIYKTETD